MLDGRHDSRPLSTLYGWEPPVRRGRERLDWMRGIHSRRAQFLRQWHRDEALRLRAEGRSYGQIARCLSVSVRRVRNVLAGLQLELKALRERASHRRESVRALVGKGTSYLDIAASLGISESHARRLGAGSSRWKRANATASEILQYSIDHPDLSYTEIGSHLAVDRHRVAGAVSHLGRQRQGPKDGGIKGGTRSGQSRRAATAERDALIVAMYADGMGYKAVGIQFGLHATTIRHIVLREKDAHAPLHSEAQRCVS